MAKEKQINVLIVDDSQVSCDLLKHIIESDPKIKVMGISKNGQEALNFLENNTPDVISMDLLMPGMDGFETTKRIIEFKPLPVVVITSAFTESNTMMALKSMEAGALVILEKPLGIKDIKRSKEIINAIKLVVDVKVIKRVYDKARGITDKSILQEKKIHEIWAVAIGASIGGPLALAEILSQLPSNLSVPIFIVQHIAAGFITGLIKWLQERSKVPIHLAQHGIKALPGHVYIAPDAYHMSVTKNGVIFLHQSENQAQPSIGHLFRSMAQAYGSHGMGVILTGMGSDGAQDLLLMKLEGAYTIAQDEKSSIVFGMANEAVKIGAVSEILSIEKIGQRMLYLLRKNRPLA